MPQPVEPFDRIRALELLADAVDAHVVSRLERPSAPDDGAKGSAHVSLGAGTAYGRLLAVGLLGASLLIGAMLHGSVVFADGA